MSELPTGTLTLLFSDMEGSTRLLQQLGERYTSVLADCRHLLRRAFSQHHGHEVDTQGDAFFVVFARASDAVAAAVAVQRALFAHAWPHGVTVRVRIGVHTGEPTLTPEGYVGLDVHHAARIMSAAHGGQVLLSPTTRQLVEQHLPEGTYVQDLGPHRLKDLQRPDHLFQVCLEGLPADFPPLKTLDASAHNLPIQPTPFIGREKEVAVVRQWLRQPEVRLVTLTGAGGMGKTRLALQVGAELVEQFADGVFLVPLAMVSDAALVVPTVMQMLSIKEAGGQSPLAVLQSALKDKQMLLLLDNFEHVIPAAVQVAELLAACPKLKLMVTSRVVLHVQAEREFVVPPLSLPHPKRLPDLVTLSQYEAVALFIQRAQAVRPDFTVTNANAPAVAEICSRLDGLPLAIELAAAKAKFFAPQALLSRLKQGLALLVGGARDLPDRQQTLRGAIAWSYDLLSAQEQSLFRRLSTFVNGCTVEAAEVVCRAAGELEGEILEGVLSLVDKSLVRQEESTEGEPRFWMLMTVRAFGLECLATSGEMQTVREAHANYYLQLAEEAFPEIFGLPQTQWLERFEQEHENVRLALNWWFERAEGTLALRLARALGPFWLYQVHFQEGRIVLEQALALAAEETLVRAEALGYLGVLLGNLGEPAHAEEVSREGLSIARAIGDPLTLAHCLYVSGLVAQNQSKYAVAYQLLEECVALSRQSGEQDALAQALSNWASVAIYQGEYERGRTLAEESLALFRERGNLVYSTYALLRLVRMSYLQGELTRAYTLAKECLALSTQERSFYKPEALYFLGAIVLEQGDPVQAGTLAEESLALSQEAGDKEGIALSLCLIGKVKARQGEHPAARTCYEQSIQIARERGLQWTLASGLEGLASVVVVQGELAWAVQLWATAEALREAIGAPLPPIERASYEQAVSVARTQLGEAAFTAAWQEGRAMSLNQVIDRAFTKGDEANKQERRTAQGTTPKRSSGKP